MATPLRFEWDEIKARTNEAKHGVPFSYAIAAFGDENRLELDASRPEDGESRAKLVGKIEGRLYTVVFAMRGTACRIISARRSNTREERSYGNHSL